MRSLFLYFFKIILVCFCIHLYSCQTDDVDHQLESQSNNDRNHSIIKTISGKDIPEILQVIQEESNKELTFSFSPSQGGHRSIEDTITGTLNTDKIRQVTDEFGTSNYTFSLTKEGHVNELSIVNYVLKETADGYYSYFLEFIPETNWLNSTSNPNDLSIFTGMIRVYDRYGIYVGENTMINGVKVSQSQRDPCVDEGESNNTGGGGNDTGNGDNSGEGQNGDSSDGNSNSDGNAGEDIDIEITCGCPQDHPGGNDAPECTCTLPDTITIYIKFTDENGLEKDKNSLRNPCLPEVNDTCSSQNDCEFGFDLNCNCLPNPDNSENTDDGIIIDLVDALLGNFLVDELGVSGELAIWIRDLDYEQKMDIQRFLEENEYSDEAKYGVNITANLSIHNLLESGYSQEFIDEVNCYNGPILIIEPDLGFQYYNYIRTEIAIIKQSEYPENYDFSNWELFKIGVRAHKNGLQLGLDIVGLIPGFGEVADVANGLIYTIDGDGVNAAFSYASAVPFVGWFSTGAKWAKRTITLANGRKTTLKWIVNAGDIINFGNRGQLGKVIGTTGTPNHAHHMVPWEFGSSPVVQKAAKADSPFHMNAPQNGIPLPSTDHLTGHNLYNNKIEEILTDFNIDNPTASFEEANDFILGLTDYLDELISINPGFNLGQISNIIDYPF
ncbi:AHH domain-containing protein [Dokdonia ponticola]|uniref:AHH domain-containing protein n=1 Tax=Dokdonia ponticola TaxID=2041041 RepID=A0ABV9I4I2_9FLAO